MEFLYLIYDASSCKCQKCAVVIWLHEYIMIPSEAEHDIISYIKFKGLENCIIDDIFCGLSLFICATNALIFCFQYIKMHLKMKCYQGWFSDPLPYNIIFYFCFKNDWPQWDDLLSHWWWYFFAVFKQRPAPSTSSAPLRCIQRKLSSSRPSKPVMER